MAGEVRRIPVKSLEEDRPMNEFLFFALFLAIWIVLNRWLLPWFGVPTCMSGACAADSPPGKKGDVE